MSTESDDALAQELARLRQTLETTTSRVWQMHGLAAGAASSSDKQLESTENQLRELRQKVEPALKSWAGMMDSRKRFYDQAAKLTRPVVVVPVVFLLLLTALIWVGRVTLQDFQVTAPGLELSGSSTEIPPEEQQ